MRAMLSIDTLHSDRSTRYAPRFLTEAAIGPFAFRDRDRFFRHRFFGPRFAFLGAGFPYGYYDDCYARVDAIGMALAVLNGNDIDRFTKLALRPLPPKPPPCARNWGRL
jgi:hypothetical protein